MYIDGRPKATQNIARFINDTWPTKTNKQPNSIFEEHEGNRELVCTIASIDVGKDLLIDYNLNRIDTEIVIVGEAHILFYATC